jgi:FG-GAP-like repeat
LPGTDFGDPAPADFNGDGKMDLVVAGQKKMQVLLGHGDGTFDTTLLTLSVPSFNNQQYGCCGAVIAGDFDHDSNADFAFLRYTPGSTEGPTALIVYYGKGDGTFSQAVTAATLDRNYVHLIAADLNGDGLSDFVLSTTEGYDYRGTAISIVHSLPGRKFSGETNLVAGAGFASMAEADFNRDGQPDLLFTNGNLADSLVLLTNVGTPAMALTSSANPSAIGQAVTFTATIGAPADLTVLPSPGTITFGGLPDGNVSVPITFAGGGSKGPFKASATMRRQACRLVRPSSRLPFPAIPFSTPHLRP